MKEYTNNLEKIETLETKHYIYGNLVHNRSSTANQVKSSS